jgi:hypothetical protein
LPIDAEGMEGIKISHDSCAQDECEIETKYKLGSEILGEGVLCYETQNILSKT